MNDIMRKGYELQAEMLEIISKNNEVYTLIMDKVKVMEEVLKEPNRGKRAEQVFEMLNAIQYSNPYRYRAEYWGNFWEKDCQIVCESTFPQPQVLNITDIYFQLLFVSIYGIKDETKLTGQMFTSRSHWINAKYK